MRLHTCGKALSCLILCAGVMVSCQAGQSSNYDGPKFSFQYPANWKIRTNGERFASAKSPADDITHVGVEFFPGMVNQPGTLVQCATVDKALIGYYEANWAIYAKSDPSNAMNRTTVTYDQLGPGTLGGRSMWISVVTTAPGQIVDSVQAWINVVPRKDGFYVVSMSHPSGPMETWEPIRQGFLKSVRLKRERLGNTDYCSY